MNENRISTPANGFRTPVWVAHALSIGGIGLMLALSVWQLQRLEWKESLMAHAYEAARQPETELDTSQDLVSLRALEFRPVRVSGEFLPGREYHLGGRYLKGKQGYSILAPFRVENGATDAGKPLLLVERGWIPGDKKNAENRPESIPSGKVTLHGVVHLPSQPRMFTPDNRPDKNFWFWPDLAAFSADLGEPLAPVMLLVTDKDAGTQLPIPSPNGIPDFRNDHLGYAITWLLLALGIGGMYCYWLKGREEDIRA